MKNKKPKHNNIMKGGVEEQESDHFSKTKETTGRVLRVHIATLLRPPFSLHCLSCSIPRQTKLDFHHIPCIYL